MRKNSAALVLSSFAFTSSQFSEQYLQPGSFSPIMYLMGNCARAGEFYHESITFHVIAVSVATQEDFDVLETKAEFFDGILNSRNIAFVDRVDQDVALRRRNKK